MSKQIWFITGTGRGMGADIAKAALAAGHAVVAPGRNPARISSALGASDDLLAVKLDVTSSDDAKDAARSAVDRFGLDRIAGSRDRAIRHPTRRSSSPELYQARGETRAVVK